MPSTWSIYHTRTRIASTVLSSERGFKRKEPDNTQQARDNTILEVRMNPNKSPSKIDVGVTCTRLRMTASRRIAQDEQSQIGIYEIVCMQCLVSKRIGQYVHTRVLRHEFSGSLRVLVSDRRAFNFREYLC